MAFSETGVVWGQYFLTSFNCQSTAPNKASWELCAVIGSPFHNSWPANLLTEHAFKACMFCVQQTHVVLDKKKLAKLCCLPKMFVKYIFLILRRNLSLFFHKCHRALFSWGTYCYLDAVSNCDCLNISSHKPQTPCQVVPFSGTLHCSIWAATCLLAWLCSFSCWSPSHNTALSVGKQRTPPITWEWRAVKWVQRAH